MLRDNPLAAEVFPNVAFWKEGDIRWVRYSCEHAGVGDALRELKAEVGRGEAQFRYVSVEAKPGGRGSSRRHALPDKQAQAAHPVLSLLTNTA